MNIKTTGIEKDIDRETARRAHNGTSFSPEKRGDSMIAEYIESMKSLAAFIEENAKDGRQQEIMQDVFDRLRESYKKKYLAWIAAKSRCISSMIAGPSNFPVRRAEKANEAEHKRCVELIDFNKKMRGYALKSLANVYSKAEKAESALDKMRRDLAGAESAQDFMKAANALARKKDFDGLRALFVDTYGEEKGSKAYQVFMKPDYAQRIGFASFQLSNNLANIKRMRARVADMEAKQRLADESPQVEKETALNGLKIVHNHEEDRLQLIFDGKPDEGVRAVLKSNGFRWSPRFGAWQRQLTRNAISATEHRVLTASALAQYKATA